jgi:WD40 repeat protein
MRRGKAVALDPQFAARIWDVATGRQRAVLEGHTSRVTAVAVAPDGSWIATSSRDGTARIWGDGHRQREDPYARGR